MRRFRGLRPRLLTLFPSGEESTMASDDTWTIANTRHDARSLGQFNSVFAVSNGYLGLKGNLAEDRDGSSPVTLINGVYDELDMFSQIRASKHDRRWLDPDYFDTAGRSPAVANLPNPLAVRVFVGDREVSITRGEIADFEQCLLLKYGVYAYGFDYRDAAGRTTRFQMERFASIVHPHRVFMRYWIARLDHDAPIRVLSGIDGRVHSNTTRERQFAVTHLEADEAGRCILHARTPARGIDVRMGVVNECVGGKPTAVRGVVEHDAAYTEYEFAGGKDEVIDLRRSAALTSSEDARHGLAVDLGAELEATAAQSYGDAGVEQGRAWEALWDRADVQIDGDETAQRYLRFSLFHLLAAAPRFTDRLSVPVKLLSGEYYQGNTFYDTDLYIVPFYTFTLPEYARTCLNFRYEGLKPGREIARKLGYEGAKFAWQAGPYGEECLGDWYRFTKTNIHIDADVAYSLMQYWWATGDEAFMRDRGGEMLAEIAWFFISRAVHDPGRDAYDLKYVSGPDEAHCESTNNFYTNYLAAQTLRWAGEKRGQVDLLRKGRQVDFSSPPTAAQTGLLAETNQPDPFFPLLFDPATKLYEQYDGFYKLPPPPPDLLTTRKDWFVPLAFYQALNQPDVVMAMVLFRDAFPPDVVRANWEYYKDKSLNFSSMSFAINSIMAADMGEMDRAYRDFMISAGSDVDESLTGRRDTFAGLHGTAMGGTWMAAVFGFGGVHLSEAGLRINPNLPPQWKTLRFNLVLRGERIRVTVDHEQVAFDVSSECSIEIPITVAGQVLTLRSGEPIVARYRRQ